MAGYLSLSDALGGLRIANPDDTASPSPTANAGPETREAPQTGSDTLTNTDLSQSASHSLPSSEPTQQQQQQPQPQPQQQLHQQQLQTPSRGTSPYPPQNQRPQAFAPSPPETQYAPHAQSGGSTRPVSTIYTSAGPPSAPSAAYGAIRSDPARSASYRHPQRTDAQADQHQPSSYVSSVSSHEADHTDRTYNGPRQNMGLVSQGNSPLPPRRSSKGMAGGYVSIPAGAASSAPPAQPGGGSASSAAASAASAAQYSAYGGEATLIKSSDEWKERGAAVSVRKEVDASGKPVLRTVKKGVQDFSFGRILGEGSYSTVYLATDRQSLKEYAIKVLEKKHIIKEKKVKYVNIEKNTLNRLTEHPGIVRLYYTFQDEASLYYVLDLCSGGELLGILKRTGTFDVECTRFYGAQILDAIRYMHSRGVIHRDLKPENVLLDENMHVKITDFGTAKLLPDPRDPRPADSGNGGGMGGVGGGSGGGGGGGGGSSQSDGRSASFVGTAEYVSPELLMDKLASKASDLWAFGCIIYQLIAGRPPFKGASEYLTFQKIVNLDYEFPPGFPPAARDLVERCLVLDPARRLTIEHIMNHEFFDGQPFGRDLWRTKAPRLRPYVPPSQETHIIQLNGGSAAPPPQPISASRGMPGSNNGGGNGSGSPAAQNNGGPRPARIITELPPPTQLDLDWSPVLTRQNERILKLGDLMVVSTPIPNTLGGDHGDGHKKLSRFFGGSTTKKRQRLVMVTSSGRIVFAPAGGDEKKAKQEISLLNSDCTWRAQTDAKGQPVWCVDTGGVHYTFEEAKAAGGMAAVEDWIESLERAKDLALSHNTLASFRSEEFGDMSMSSNMSSPSSTLGGRMMQQGMGMGGSGDDKVVSERKRNRFSKRQSKSGLGAGLGAGQF